MTMGVFDFDNNIEQAGQEAVLNCINPEFCRCFFSSVDEQAMKKRLKLRNDTLLSRHDVYILSNQYPYKHISEYMPSVCNIESDIYDVELRMAGFVNVNEKFVNNIICGKIYAYCCGSYTTLTNINHTIEHARFADNSIFFQGNQNVVELVDCNFTFTDNNEVDKNVIRFNSSCELAKLKNCTFSGFEKTKFKGVILSYRMVSRQREQLTRMIQAGQSNKKSRILDNVMYWLEFPIQSSYTGDDIFMNIEYNSIHDIFGDFPDEVKRIEIIYDYCHRPKLIFTKEKLKSEKVDIVFKDGWNVYTELAKLIEL